METFLFLPTYRNSQKRLTFMAYNDYKSFLLRLQIICRQDCFSLLITSRQRSNGYVWNVNSLAYSLSCWTTCFFHVIFTVYVSTEKRQIGQLRYINILAWLRGIQDKIRSQFSESWIQKKPQIHGCLSWKRRSHEYWILIFPTRPITQEQLRDILNR